MLEEDNASLFLASNVSHPVYQILDDRAYQIQQTLDVPLAFRYSLCNHQNNSLAQCMDSYFRPILISALIIIALLVASYFVGFPSPPTPSQPLSDEAVLSRLSLPEEYLESVYPPASFPLESTEPCQD